VDRKGGVKGRRGREEWRGRRNQRGEERRKREGAGRRGDEKRDEGKPGPNAP
jgi:hypothetical protein